MENENKEMNRSIFNHTFTWLKVMMAAYVVYYFAFQFSISFTAPFDKSCFLILIYPCILGLVLGFILNLIYNFKRAAFLFSIGHLLSFILGLSLFFSISGNNENVSEKVDVIYATSNKNDSANHIEYNTANVLKRYDSYIQRAKDKMSQEYAGLDFNYYVIYLERADTVNQDNDSVVNCYVLFYTNGNALDFIYDKYWITPTRFEVLISGVTAKDTTFSKVSDEIIKVDSIFSWAQKKFPNN